MRVPKGSCGLVQMWFWNNNVNDDGDITFLITIHYDLQNSLKTPHSEETSPNEVNLSFSLGHGVDDDDDDGDCLCTHDAKPCFFGHRVDRRAHLEWNCCAEVPSPNRDEEPEHTYTHTRSRWWLRAILKGKVWWLYGYSKLAFFEDTYMKCCVSSSTVHWLIGELTHAGNLTLQ